MIRPDLSQLPAYVPGTTIDGALKLASNESCLPPLPSVVDAMAQAAAGVNRYPDMGAIDLRDAIAHWLNSGTAQGFDTECAHGFGNDLNLTRDNVAVGNGSSALCLQTIQATCQMGDQVLFAWRSFEAYPILSCIAGAEPVAIPLTSDHRHDLDAMVGAITDRTRLIMVCNPNNPTGSTITAAEFDAFMARVPADIHVVLDEAYAEYVRVDNPTDSPHAASVLSRYPNVAVLRTMSKAYGLAGARLGYLVAQPDFVEAINKVGIPFGVNSMSQAAGLACLEPQAQQELLERVDETVQERARVLDFLSSRDDVEAIASQANFVWLAVGDKAQKLDAELKDRGIVARCFNGEGVRVTCTDKQETDRLLAALGPALDALK